MSGPIPSRSMSVPLRLDKAGLDEGQAIVEFDTVDYGKIRLVSLAAPSRRDRTRPGKRDCEW